MVENGTGFHFSGSHTHPVALFDGLVVVTCGFVAAVAADAAVGPFVCSLSAAVTVAGFVVICPEVDNADDEGSVAGSLACPDISLEENEAAVVCAKLPVVSADGFRDAHPAAASSSAASNRINDFFMMPLPWFFMHNSSMLRQAPYTTVSLPCTLIPAQ